MESHGFGFAFVQLLFEACTDQFKLKPSPNLSIPFKLYEREVNI